MKADLHFDIRVDAATATITVEREFAAPRHLVWDCYTRSDLLDRWFAPEPLTTKTAAMDFREGGHWLYAMVEPDGREHWGRLDYRTIEPIDRFTALDSFCHDDGTPNPNLPASSWDVTFTDAGARTLVRTVVSYGSPDDVETVVAMGMKEGMASTLERLDTLLGRLEAGGAAAT